MGQKFFFFFNDTATTEIYTLSLHDALPISARRGEGRMRVSALALKRKQREPFAFASPSDRKSTRLNSSHSQISYAVFCLKKKKRKAVGGVEYLEAPLHELAAVQVTPDSIII